MGRQVGLVLGTSIMVSLLGTGVPALDRFQHVWVFLVVASLVAAAAALAMEAVRRPAVAPVLAPVE
jgi:hypothetical protein